MTSLGTIPRRLLTLIRGGGNPDEDIDFSWRKFEVIEGGAAQAAADAEFEFRHSDPFVASCERARAQEAEQDQ